MTFRPPVQVRDDFDERAKAAGRSRSDALIEAMHDWIRKQDRMGHISAADLLAGVAVEAGLSFDEPRDGLQLFADTSPAVPLVLLKCTICGGPPIDRAYLYHRNLQAVADDFRTAVAQHQHSAAAVQPDPGSST